MAGTRLQRPSPVALQQKPPPNTLRKKPPPVSMHSHPAMSKQRPPPLPVSFDNNVKSSPAVLTRRRHGSLSVVNTSEAQYQQYQYYAPYQATTPAPDSRSSSNNHSNSNSNSRRSHDGHRGRSADVVVDDSTSRKNTTATNTNNQ
ncbi:hypothetical protein PG985_003285 [Apiospora marii]|uniref:Uncharacterized protein n=1 Tax=Apiospora marii TaxID=335849 RepID=A0ABR1RV62_9PEZI